MVNLDIKKQNDIRGQGYGIQFKGMETFKLSLYLHQDTLSDKKLGDVFMKYKIGNPVVGPNNAEKDYLARKGSGMGVYAWKPGEDCLVKEFTNVKYVKDLVGGGTRVVKLEPDMGCRWCRGRSATTSSEHEAGAVSTFEAEPVTEVSPPPPTAKCFVCGYEPKLINKRGRSFSLLERETHVTAHIRTKHPEAVTPLGVPTVRSVGVGEDTN